jgi:hypothetical protein
LIIVDVGRRGEEIVVLGGIHAQINLDGADIENLSHQRNSNMGCLLALPTKALEDIVFRFIIEYNSS